MNKPLTAQQVKDLPKGMNITRTFLDLNKKTGKVSYYPNRRERRNIMFGKNKPCINNKKPKKSRHTRLQRIPMFTNELGKYIHKHMIAGKDYLKLIFSGFKNIFHQKTFKNWTPYQPVI